MRLRISVLVLACGLSACADTTAPDDTTLVGEWAAPAETLANGSSYQVLLTIRRDNSYSTETQNFASLAAQAKGEVSRYTRFEGTYLVRNDSLFTHPDRWISWDSANGPNSPVQVVPVDPVIAHALADGMYLELSGEALVLHYISFPVDEPVETTQTFHRVH
ncbi:MAG: hypothetical protein ABJF01_05285 [bacterium]